MNELFEFYTSAKSKWGDLQQKISETLCKCLEYGKDFFVRIGREKTASQLRGYFRLCNLIVPYWQDEWGGYVDKDVVSNYIKITSKYYAYIRNEKIPKSLKNATVPDMKLFIEELYIVCEGFGIKDYELTSAEKDAMNKYYQLIKKQ
tara:strand:+ start:12784 stop:13224 length:441 start_codon:yes stop_codon:yes gene_type:complete